MKHFKHFNLLATAVIASLVFASDASAAYVTETTNGSTAAPTVHIVNGGGHVTLKNPIANISCSLTLEGKIEYDKVGEGNSPAGGNISKLEFTSCTNIWHGTTTANGGFFFTYTGDHSGLLGSTGTQFDMTRLGVTCVYETNFTKLGNVTGGNPATINFNGSIPINAFLSSGLCGTASAAIEGSAVTTSALYLEQ